MTAAPKANDIRQQQGSTTQPIVVPPLTPEEEDQIILTRITNDERPLRRVIKKFHAYTALAYEPLTPQVDSNLTTTPTPDRNLTKSGTDSPAVSDAREAFLVELASFQLALKKSALICEAEARQVEEYERARRNLDDEHGTLIAQIDELKSALEHAQVLRRRKIEYDVVAEKVNMLPPREELEQSIKELENDISTIRTEHETQTRTIQGQKAALDGIIGELGALRLLGKLPEPEPEVDPEVEVGEGEGKQQSEEYKEGDTSVDVNRGNEGVDGQMQDGEAELGDPPSDHQIHTQEISDGDNITRESTAPISVEGEGSEGDIEMGEVEEEPRDKNPQKLRRFREDLEEGEATDASSELSEPPDD